MELLRLELLNPDQTDSFWLDFRIRQTGIAQKWASLVEESMPISKPIFEVYPVEDQDEMEFQIGEAVLRLISDWNRSREGDRLETPTDSQIVNPGWINQTCSWFQRQGREDWALRFREYESKVSVVLNRQHQPIPGMVQWGFEPFRNIPLDQEDEKQFRLGQQFGTIYLTNPSSDPTLIDCFHRKFPLGEAVPQQGYSANFMLWLGESWPFQYERDVRSAIRDELGEIKPGHRLGMIPVAILAQDSSLPALWRKLQKYPIRGFVKLE